MAANTVHYLRTIRRSACELFVDSTRFSPRRASECAGGRREAGDDEGGSRLLGSRQPRLVQPQSPHQVNPLSHTLENMSPSTVLPHPETLNFSLPFYRYLLKVVQKHECTGP